MYKLIKQALFKLDPERAHHLSLAALNLCYQLGLTALIKKIPPSPCKVMGLNFPNKVGLAAGMDKNGDYIDALAALGFGFIEIGTITPKPQAGNPRPRLFRLINNQAIINRMGFNSKGIDYTLNNLEKIRYKGVLGINIGKNRDTPNDNAADDYLAGMRAFWRYASYLTINISSPNTSGLRDLQHAEQLTALLKTLKAEQSRLHQAENKYVPLVVKIAPDLSTDELDAIADVLLSQKIDGVIATNTTTQREGVMDSPFAKEAGGLSGKPLCALNTCVIQQLHSRLQNAIPIIASGGIMDVASARDKIKAGAQLLQIYTGFVYEGPELISALVYACE